MRVQRSELPGLGIVVAAGASYAVATIAAKLAYRRGATPATVIEVRFVLAALVLLGLAAVMRRPLRLRRGPLVRLVLMGGVTAIVAALFFGSLERVPASTATLLLYAHPALVAAAAFALGREAVGVATIAVLALALVGVGLVLGTPEGAIDGTGVAMALGAAVAITVFVVMAQRALVDASPLVASGVLIGVAAVLFGGAAGALGAFHGPDTPAAWGWMGGVGLSTASAVGLFLAAVDRLGPTGAAIGTTVEPMFTVLLSVAILGESLSPAQLVGAVLLLAAVACLPLVRRRVGGRVRTPP